MNQNLLIQFFVLILALATRNANSDPAEDATWHVHIVNGLSNNKILFVHCKSGDDDLGMHNLTVNTETTWHFRMNFFGTTLYWCYLSLRQQQLHAQFDVFYYDRNIFYICNYSDWIWTARDEGFYLKNIRENRDEFMHKWEQGALV